MAAVTIQDRIKGARVMAGLTRQQLADRLGVSIETVRRRENGDSEVTNETLGALAQATGVPFAFLVEGFSDDQINASMAEVLARAHLQDQPAVLPDPDQPPAG